MRMAYRATKAIYCPFPIIAGARQIIFGAKARSIFGAKAKAGFWHEACSSAASTLPVKTILILDDNLGFVCWLGKTLADAGYQAVPATQITEALTLIASSDLTIGVLIVNPAAQGAKEFIETLRGDRDDLRVIAAVEDPAAEHVTVTEVDGVGRKPPF